MQGTKEFKEAETLFEALKVTAKKIKQEYDERIDPATTGELANKIKRYAKYVFIGCSVIAAMPLTFPANVISWLNWIILASGLIAGMTKLDKSKITK